MATIAALPVTLAGVLKVFTAAEIGGDQFLNTGNEIIEVNNGSGVSVTVTFAPAGLPGGLSLATFGVTLTPSSTRIIGKFNSSLFSTATGFVTMTYSAVTSVNVVVLRVPGG